MPGFRDDLVRRATALSIASADFHAVGIHAWPAIMHKIEAAFIRKTNSNTHFNWWWESFKDPQYRLFFEDGPAYTLLTQLLDIHELVWFVACDSNTDPSKFWLFEGSVQAVQLMLHNSYTFEYYVVSKKYLWLLCETDHHELIGLGTIIPTMQHLSSSLL